MEQNWTKEQRQAIESRVPELSVSASAGSGKTSTMVARIVDLLQYGSADAGELLVLTFTNESARDMRTKLTHTLEERILQTANTEKRAVLVRQLLDLPSADIGTFHKFCGLVVRQWFSAAGVNPGFSVIDEIEAGKIKAEIFEKMLTDCYNGAAKQVIDRFAVNRNFNGLRDTVFELHRFLESRKDRAQWLNGTAARCYNDDIDENAAVKLLIEHYNKLARWYRDKFIEMGYNSTEPQHIVGVADIIISISCYGDLCKFADSDIKVKQVERGAAQDYRDLRDDFKKNVLNEIKSNFQNLSADELKKGIKNDREIIEGLIYLVREFYSRYSFLKLEKNRMDFADLEKYTLKVLGDPAAAAGVRGKYKYIFVDEGQDINPVQFDIIKKLIFGSNGIENFFMVGDVKQSIYGFRGCEPDMFESEIAKPNDDRHTSILFNDNFRSNPKILQFVNDIFCSVMERPNYAADGKFKMGAPYMDEKFEAVEIEIADTVKDGGGDGGAITVTKPYDITADTESSEGTRDIDVQIGLVARHIKKLVGVDYWVPKGKGRGEYRTFTFGDIAILAETRTHFTKLAGALRESGINCAVDEKVNVTEIPETAVLHNFLFAVSNWTNDLPLVLTMQSAAFGFTDDEISRVRLSGSNLPFIDCIEKYIKDGADAGLRKRLTAFTQMLTKYNALVRTESAAKVLLTFIAEYKYLERLNSPDGVWAVNSFISKIKNLTVADSTARYLYLIEHDLIRIEINLGGAADNAVRIMTIHGAKGLEFPAVILFNTTASWGSQGDRKTPITVDREFGICIQHADTQNYIRSNSVLQLAVKNRQHIKELDEKMRLLYVAVTRPKNHLFITGAKNVGRIKRYLADTPFAKCMFDLIYAGRIDKSILSIKNAGGAGRGAEYGAGRGVGHGARKGIPCAERINNSTLLGGGAAGQSAEQWAAQGAEQNAERGAEQRATQGAGRGATADAPKRPPAGGGSVAENINDKLLQKLRAAFAWEYPNKKMTETHIKQSVTSLTRSENETADFAAPMRFNNIDRAGAEYGTAFHKSMQYGGTQCRVSAEQSEDRYGGAQRRMSAKRSEDRYGGAEPRVPAGRGGGHGGAIDKEVAAAEDIINSFLAGYTVYREVPFLSAMDDGTIVQGIIDLLAVKDETAVIIDYKTTRADERRLTELYTPQLRLYANAVSKFLPNHRVLTYIYSVRHQKLLAVSV
jgi:ATP-dependent helicase/nuclease subunit A